MSDQHKSKRQRQQHQTVRRCVNCHADVRKSSYARIEDARGKSLDCTHALCIVCFGTAHARRSADLKLKCLGQRCTRASRKWTVFSYDGSAHHENDQEVRIPRSRGDWYNHPVQFYENKGTQWRREHAILSVSTTKPPLTPGQEGMSIRTNTFCSVLNVNQSLTTTDNAAELARIGKTLHPFLQHPNDKQSQSHQTYANPSAISINQLEAHDLFSAALLHPRPLYWQHVEAISRSLCAGQETVVPEGIQRNLHCYGSDPLRQGRGAPQ